MVEVARYAAGVTYQMLAFAAAFHAATRHQQGQVLFAGIRFFLPAGGYQGADVFYRLFVLTVHYVGEIVSECGRCVRKGVECCSEQCTFNVLTD